MMTLNSVQFAGYYEIEGKIKDIRKTMTALQAKDPDVVFFATDAMLDRQEEFRRRDEEARKNGGISTMAGYSDTMRNEVFTAEDATRYNELTIQQAEADAERHARGEQGQMALPEFFDFLIGLRGEGQPPPALNAKKVTKALKKGKFDVENGQFLNKKA